MNGEFTDQTKEREYRDIIRYTPCKKHLGIDMDEAMRETVFGARAIAR